MALRLKSYEFRREREASWRRLDALVTRVEKRGQDALDPDDLAQLSQLYRAALSSLSVARAISLDRNLLSYLESLCQRAFFCVYGARQGLSRALGTFFLERLPASVRRLGGFVAVAALFLALGVLAGFVLTRAEPDRFYSFVGADLAGGRGPEASTEVLRDALYSTGSGEELGYFAAALFRHNAGVGLLTYTLGFVAGIPVFILLLTNGMMLGAFVALYASRGLSYEFWAWLMPHGGTELLALVLFGAAGLALGQALVFPGRHGRLVNLARRGRETAPLAIGAILLLLVAGLMEGIFRQTVHDPTVRYTVALGLGGLWALYFLGVRRRGDGDPA